MVGSFYFVWRFWLAGIAGGMKDYEGRSSPACHFERKREIFSVCGQSVYACERKREACLSRALGDTVLHADGLVQVSRKG